jgi:hypothetical protein
MGTIIQILNCITLALLNIFGENVVSVGKWDLLIIIDSFELSGVTTPVWRSDLAAAPEGYGFAIWQHYPQASLEEEPHPWE